MTASKDHAAKFYGGLQDTTVTQMGHCLSARRRSRNSDVMGVSILHSHHTAAELWLSSGSPHTHTAFLLCDALTDILLSGRRTHTLRVIARVNHCRPVPVKRHAGGRRPEGEAVHFSNPGAAARLHQKIVSQPPSLHDTAIGIVRRCWRQVECRH